MLAFITDGPYQDLKLTIAREAEKRKNVLSQSKLTAEPGPLSSMVVSILSLTCFFYFREGLTPDLLHFVSCMEEDQVHFIWVFVLWALSKNFFRPERDNFVK